MSILGRTQGRTIDAENNIGAPKNAKINLVYFKTAIFVAILRSKSRKEAKRLN